MKGTLISVQGIRYSVPPKLGLNIEVENETPNQVVWIFGGVGLVSLEQPRRVDLGKLETRFTRLQLQPLQKYRLDFEWEIGHDKLERIEEERKGKDLFLDVRLNLLQIALPKGAPITTPVFDKLGGSEVIVSSPGHDTVRIPKSVWEDKLEELGYGKVEYLELQLPPPPEGTQLDAALKHLEKAKGHFNSGDYPDVLTSCRKAIDELQKLCGSSEEERKDFIKQVLQDSKKAQAYTDLLEVVQSAKNFASGGPHTYWVKAADRRDAEFALRITWAIVGYFAKNLARAKG